MRLEQENDDLAHELVTSKIALRKDLDNVSLTQLQGETVFPTDSSSSCEITVIGVLVSYPPLRVQARPHSFPPPVGVSDELRKPA